MLNYQRVGVAHLNRHRNAGPPTSAQHHLLFGFLDFFASENPNSVWEGETSKFRVFMIENNDATGRIDEKCMCVPYVQTKRYDLTE